METEPLRGRLARAEALHEERRRRKERCRVIDCLQLVDKARILVRDPEMLAHMGYESRHAADEAVKALDSLRNNLAHAQDITSRNWDGIVQMSRRLDRVMTRIE